LFGVGTTWGAARWFVRPFAAWDKEPLLAGVH
jgi:hypothetical protein